MTTRGGCAGDASVTVENDVNLAALGEHARGLGRGIDDFAFVSVGTGLGAGLVLGGELRRGRHGAAGELEASCAKPTTRTTEPSPRPSRPSRPGSRPATAGTSAPGPRRQPRP